MLLRDIPDLALAGLWIAGCGVLGVALHGLAVGAVDLLDWLLERRRSKCE